MTTPNYSQTPNIQGQGDIIINAPVSAVWQLIKDSKRLEDWGPPVQKVEVFLNAGQTEEGEGSKRKVFAKFNEKRKGWYQEIRTEQIDGRKITFLIYEDSFGMAKILNIPVAETTGGFMFCYSSNSFNCFTSSFLP